MPTKLTATLALAVVMSTAAFAQAQEGADPAQAAPAQEGAMEQAAPAPSEDGASAASGAGSVDQAATADADSTSVQQLAPLIADVQVVGPWMDGDRQGIWRTVMLQPSSHSEGNRFFVQQIEEVDGTPTVTSSTEITEVAEMDAAVVAYRPDEPSEAQPELLTLFLDLVPLDGEIAETYELFFTAGEPYTFGPASN